MNADPTPIAADEVRMDGGSVDDKKSAGEYINAFIGGNRRGIGVHRRLQCFSSAAIGEGSAFIGAFKALGPPHSPPPPTSR